ASAQSASVGRRGAAERAHGWSSFHETWATGWSSIPSIEDPGPVGAVHVAPWTPRHHGVPGTWPGRRWWSASPSTNASKTNDQPNRSASVTCPVRSEERGVGDEGRVAETVYDGR